MKSIGFTNFRRFEKLEPLQLGDITFFVGGNNAGKSTVVKAMMLLLDNLSAKTQINRADKAFPNPTFLLDANRIHEVHIGTFGRALHKPYSGRKELILEAEIDNYRFCYVLTGDVESTQANADINCIIFENKDTNVQYTFDFEHGEAIIRYNTSLLKNFVNSYPRFSPDNSEELQNRIDALQKQRSELQIEMKGVEDDAVKSARINADIKSVDRQIRQLQRQMDPFEGKLKIEDVEVKCPINLSPSVVRTNLLGEVLYSISERFDDRISTRHSDGIRILTTSVPSGLSEKELAFGRMINNEVMRLAALRNRNSIEYISAHSASQKVLFSIEDKNDYMASVIREFKQSRINKGDKEDIFITRWMEQLNIGLNYVINPISGEAYTVEITNKFGETMPLADMGMGSIQMMLLLFKLATIIRNKQKSGCLVIVEEPEQNIHPKLQSLLTDLFVEVNKNYGFRFVIETHSEYMIRKSQVLVAQINTDKQEDLNTECQIVTYYFPEDREPYKMEYGIQGNFTRPFGDGFYDEADKLAMRLML